MFYRDNRRALKSLLAKRSEWKYTEQLPPDGLSLAVKRQKLYGRKRMQNLDTLSPTMN